MKITPGSVVAGEGEHVVLTGPIQGTVTLPDGEVVDVTADGVVARDPQHALAIADAIGAHWADPSTPNHPDHVGVNEDGTVEVQPFEYDAEQSKKNMRAALRTSKES